MTHNLGIRLFHAAVHGCKNTIFKDFRLCLHPIVQGMAIPWAALVVKLLGARAYLALDELHHKLSLLPSTGFDVHFHSSLV